MEATLARKAFPGLLSSPFLSGQPVGHGSVPFPGTRPAASRAITASLARRRGPAREVALGLGRREAQGPGALLVCGVTVVGRSEDVPASEDGEECEVVHGSDVVLGEGVLPGTQVAPLKADDRNRFRGYMVVPLKNRNGSGVLLLPDVLGCQSKESREFAHRLACFGYTILVPDLFRGNPWDESLPGDEFEQWRAMHANPEKRVAQDIATAATYLKTHLQQTGELEPSVLPKLAIMGFCFGGGRALEALARDGAEDKPRFATGVSFYGTRFDGDAVAKDIKVPVLMILGDKDPYCPVEAFSKVGDRVNGSEVLVYPDRGHAFVHRPATMDDDDDAENAFQVARHWLHKHLLMDSEYN